MEFELNAFMENHTWDIVPLPPHQKLIGCKLVYKIKFKADGSIERYKACLVVKGFTQREDFNYHETFFTYCKGNHSPLLLICCSHSELVSVSNGCPQHISL